MLFQARKVIINVVSIVKYYGAMDDFNIKKRIRFIQAPIST
jgi:hypothetical protein